MYYLLATDNTRLVVFLYGATIFLSISDLSSKTQVFYILGENCSHMNFRNIPPGILKMLNPIKGKSNFKFIEEKNGFTIKHHFDGSPYKFVLIKPENTQKNYGIIRVPTNDQILHGHTMYFDFKGIEHALNEWLKLVDEANKEAEELEDPITKAYREEFEAKFKFLEDVEGNTPYNLETQLALDEFLSNAIEVIKEERKINDSEELKIAEIEAIELKKNQTKLNKNNVRKKLSKVVANVQKHSLSFLKKLMSKGNARLFDFILDKGGEGIKALMEYGENLV